MSEMRLSEAMRLGAMNRPQARKDYQKDGATCAMGAALDACGVLGSLGEPRTMAERRWPLLMAPLVRHPESDNYMCPLWDAIITLNDHFNWTREQIADFVETIEQAQTTPERETVSASVNGE